VPSEHAAQQKDPVQPDEPVQPAEPDEPARPEAEPNDAGLAPDSAVEPGVVADFPEPATPGSVTPEPVTLEPVTLEPVTLEPVTLEPVTPEPAASRATAAGLSVVAGLLFAVLAIWVAQRGSAVPAVDERIHSWAISHRGPGSAAAARAIRWGGVTWIVLPALIVIGAATARARGDLGRRIRSGLLLCLVASAGVYVEIQINQAIARIRPPRVDWAGAAAGSSFPSGHTTAATLFAISCAWAVAARVPRGWPRRAVWAGAAAYAATVGWSRVWLGVHWPTDVLGGWLFSIAWFAGSVVVIRTLQRPASDDPVLLPKG
jgi:membrane-associated phospholipid phosphatase